MDITQIALTRRCNRILVSQVSHCYPWTAGSSVLCTHVMKDGVQASSQKRRSRQDFPTPGLHLEEGVHVDSQYMDL